VDNTTKGHSRKISKNRSKLDIRKFFRERVVNRWKKLSQEDVDQMSANEFKRILEKDKKFSWTSSWTNCGENPSGHIYFF